MAMYIEVNGEEITVDTVQMPEGVRCGESSGTRSPGSATGKSEN